MDASEQTQIGMHNAVLQATSHKCRLADVYDYEDIMRKSIVYEYQDYEVG